MPLSKVIATAVLALNGASALVVSAATHAPARPAVDSASWAHTAINRDVMEDDMHATPPLPRMELVDMQMLDMELYDMEVRQTEEWYQELLASDLPGADLDFAMEVEEDSLSASAFIRA